MVVNIDALSLQACRVTPTSLSRRILVIDGDDDVRGILHDRLSALGFQVTVESDGNAGLSRLTVDQHTNPFHGLLVELFLPGLNGSAVLREVRARFPTIPVIVMADSLHVADLRQAMNAGAKEYIVKPFDSELFRRKCLSVFQE
ncbi:putative Chemotaxis protein CheY [Nitrospira japonica]|uniref:Putative Chemotaxis protein CheY n=1 Tax=Nitrospira japonica TaxID=1325564 RepID=A0A1W1I5F6_9BACT|nr:putative Chemotaxis protein CheY [Nitrospira japonica]